MKQVLKNGFVYLFLILGTNVTLWGQDEYQPTTKEVMAQPNLYIWGEAKGLTYQIAKAHALQAIASQISVQIESIVISIQNQHTQQGKGHPNQKHTVFSDSFGSYIKSYSNILISNATDIVLSKPDAPEVNIFVFIKKSDITKLFEERKQKIYSYVKLALEAEDRIQIADATRLLYWALLLTKSHPDVLGMYYKPNPDKPKDSLLLVTWLPEKLNQIFNAIKASVNGIEGENTNVKTITMFCVYKGKPVTNLDFKYHDGNTFTESNGCKDGFGHLEFVGSQAKFINKYIIEVEYEFKSLARADKEVEILQNEGHGQAFPKSRITLGNASLNPTHYPHQKSKLKKYQDEAHYTPHSTERNLEPTLVYKDESQVKSIQSVNQHPILNATMTQIVQAINTKNWQSLKPLFSAEAWEQFNKMAIYGNVTLVKSDSLTFENFDDKIIVRPLKLKFSFPNSNKKFVEDLVLNYDTLTKKIDNINFGLNQIALKSIENQSLWSWHDRQVLIQTMESYKTAYCLKNIDFLKSVFDDNAIIIVGKKITATNQNDYKNHSKVVLNRYDKKTYLKNLERAFQTNEFINIEFEKSTVRKGGKNGNIYGIQIKQNYHSSHYADQGHLFLMLDLNDPKKPIIHVRTWQPVDDLSIPPYSLGDF